MPQISGRLTDGKPIVQIAVAKSVPTPTGVSAVAAPVEYNIRHYRALLDTGANITCICQRVVEECGLRQYGLVQMSGAVGLNLHPSYIIRMGIWCEDQHDFEGVAQVSQVLYQLPNVIEAARIQDNSWFDIIIGTDIISEHTLTFFKGGSFQMVLG